MSVKRYDFDCYAFYDSARLDVQECEDGDYVLHTDYAALLARVARLEESLKEIPTLYWIDAPAPEEMRRIARRAMEER